MNKRQMRRTAKALLTIGEFIDEERKKLYDKQESLRLSHNRKYLLLKKIYNKLNNILKFWACDESLKFEINVLMQQIDQELMFIGRKNWRLK